MVPTISLDYASGGGDSLAGVGWNVSGLSAITRCPQTLAQDGANVSVTYTSTDRFCLDGQRLILTSGTYGAASSVYHTENENFLSIVASSAMVGSGPDFFTVKTKSGQTLEYGNNNPANNANNNSGVILTGASSVIGTWNLDAVTDTTGNYMIVKYLKNPSGISLNEVVPSEIDYTGNGTALSPYNKVQFVYANDTRSDIVPRYTLGSMIETTQRLTDIQTWSGTQSSKFSTEVNDYQLSYSAYSATGRSILTSVKMCDAAGSNCLPARVFSYQIDGLGAGGLLPTANVNTNFDGLNGQYVGYAIFPGDFAGSGQSSLLLSSNNGTEILLNKGGVLSPVAATETYPSSVGAAALASSIIGFTPVIGDFNGDGKADIFWGKYSTTNGETSLVASYIWLSNGDGTFSVVTNPITTNIGSSNVVGVLGVTKALVGDFNGDGKSDIFFYYADQYGRSSTYSVSFGDGFVEQEWDLGLWSGNCTKNNCPASTSQYLLGLGSQPTTMPYVEDLNGDGKSDIIWISENGYGDWVNIPTGQSSSIANVWYGPIGFSTPVQLGQTLTGPTGSFDVTSLVDYTPVWGDYNGDGLPDIFWDQVDNYGRSSGPAVLWTNEGNGAFNAETVPSTLTGAVNGYRAIPADFIGDGMTDILWDHEGVDGGSNGARTLWTSTGEVNNPSNMFVVNSTNVAGMNGSGTTNMVDSTTTSSPQSALYLSTAFHPIVGDFNGDGRADILWDDYNQYGASQGTRYLWTSDGVEPDLISVLNNMNSLSNTGIGASTYIVYGTVPMGWGTYYAGWPSSTCTAAPAPANAIDVALPMPVVTYTSSTTGVSASNTYGSSFTYSCARADTTGHGFLGFAQETVTDSQTGIEQTTNFLQSYPYIGMISSETKTLGSITLNSTTNCYGALAGGSSSSATTCSGVNLNYTPPALPWNGSQTSEVAPQFPYLYQSTVSSNDLKETAPTVTALPTATSGPSTPSATAMALPGAVTTYNYDAYGDATSVDTVKSDGSYQQTTNTYDLSANATSKWLLGRLLTSSVTSYSP